MSKDEEYIMSRLIDFISNGEAALKHYEMDLEQVADFIEHIVSVERNVNPNSFPDFVGTNMDVEVFNISS